MMKPAHTYFYLFILYILFECCRAQITTNYLYPYDLKTNSGSVSSADISPLQLKDQSDYDNDSSKYVQFYGMCVHNKRIMKV